LYSVLFIVAGTTATSQHTGSLSDDCQPTPCHSSAGVTESDGGGTVHVVSSERSEQPSSSTPAYISPSAIRPFPKRADLIAKNKRASMRSELFTASPFKNRLEQKKQGIENKKLKMGLIQRKKKKPEKKKMCRDSRRKRKLAVAEQPGGSKNMKVDSRRPTKQGEARNDMSTLFCPACDEAFVDPPDEDWIQCCSCRKWWHAECTAYESGSFRCDLCG